ncbi:hypothetical protein E4U42_005577 [Claviceps africana]|uniref:Endoplasmic reticulum junction formation protein lunapark n=1 Tax=Claviceps africana TaxID=83212 RepID=A0A8K0J429_9HYPO|nr:hypothetical protein E4U42_005577 [Claviceps africana]
MVSFWPWRADSSSPASFEKTLSTLSAKITDAQARLDRLRTSSRRAKVLWTLYLGFAYLVYAIVLLLVVGYKSLGVYEWAGMIGGPLLIYLIRAITSAYFTYRIDTTSTRLKAHQDERTKTIQKLKDATKYDSTLELIEKYGGENKQQPNKGGGDAPNQTATGKATTAKKGGAPRASGRTNLPPPATANIVRPDSPAARPAVKDGEDQQSTGAEFAPNAYADAPPAPPAPRIHPQQYVAPETHWYDRIFDVLLGEDETAARNRYALICHACRLVNGQAPPGTASLAEIGMWRCSGCGATNGEEDEGRRIMNEVLASTDDGTRSAKAVDAPEAPQAGDDDAAVDEPPSSVADTPAAAVKARRRRAKQES